MKRGRWRYLLGLGFGALLALGSCESFSNYCAEKMDCEGGNDADIDACEVEEEARDEWASEIGCSEWQDAYVECREERARCVNGNYVLVDNDCDDEARDCGSCGCAQDYNPPQPGGGQ